MRYLVPIVLFLCVACSSKDNKMCDCLKASDELNELTTSILNNEEITDSKVAKIKEIKAKRETLCTDFQTMSGAEMLQKKEACQE